MRDVSQHYRAAIQQHRDRGYRNSVYARILIGSHLFEHNRILGLEHTRRAHPLSLSLPSSSLTFSINNENGEFENGTASDIQQYLKEGQQVTLYYGMDLIGAGDLRDVEWFVGGYFFLDSWKTVGAKATFTAVDVFYSLSKTIYKKGTFDGLYHSVKELALQVLQDANVSNYLIDGSHTTGNFTAWPMPLVSHAECLQLLANLSNSSLEQDPTGDIIFRHRLPTDRSLWSAYIYSELPSPPLLPGSRVADIVTTDDKYSYATWENNFFAPDGNMRLYPSGMPALPKGMELDIFPDFVTGYRYLGSIVGAYVSFGAEISFGTIRVDFSEYSKISRVRVIALNSAGVTRFDRTYDVDGPVFQITEAFTDVAYLAVAPLKNLEYHRLRINAISVDDAQWPFLTTQDILGLPDIETPKACKDLIVRGHTQSFWAPGTPITKLQTASILPGQLMEIRHTEASYLVEARSNNPSVVFEIAEHYAYVSFIQISGVTELTEIELWGHHFAATGEFTKAGPMSLLGEDLEIDNPILQTSSEAINMLTWASNYYSTRDVKTLPTLGYPEADAGDTMTYRGKTHTIIENKITMSEGSMRGVLIVRG